MFGWVWGLFFCWWFVVLVVFTAELAELLGAKQTNISLRYELMSRSNHIHYLSNLLLPKSVCKKLRHISKVFLNSDQLNLKILTTTILISMNKSWGFLYM